jgi:protein KRI1
MELLGDSSESENEVLSKSVQKSKSKKDKKQQLSSTGVEKAVAKKEPTTTGLQINEKFASEFEQRERLKDLHRHKELVQQGLLSDEESDSESSEDEDAELLSPSIDLKIVQTIASLKKKDPRIYDQSTKWFDQPAEASEGTGAADQPQKKKKYKDVLREQLLREGADISDSDEDTSLALGSKKGLVYDKEQEKLRREFLTAAGSDNDNDNDDEEDDDDLLQVKPKSDAEQAKEQDDLRKALEELDGLREENEDEQFLQKYLSQQLWKQPERTVRVDPIDEEDQDREEEELDKAELFESKYNFRFEELADKNQKQSENAGNIIGSSAYQVVGHARNTEGSLRRDDEKRKKEREARKERKEKEKRQKAEELKRLKNLKKQEVFFSQKATCCFVRWSELTTDWMTCCLFSASRPFVQNRLTSRLEISLTGRVVS